MKPAESHKSRGDKMHILGGLNVI